MRVAITGATGLIGSALVDGLRARDHEPIRIVRSEPQGTDIVWAPSEGTLDPQSLAGVDAVVNLAGPGIGDHRWTDEYKRTLHDARVKATHLIASAMAGLDSGPRVLVSGSAIGYYGSSRDATFDETSPAADDFLARLCVDWEAAAAPAADAGFRLAYIRTGIVLSADGGALAKMLPLFKLGLGGRFGSGKQWQSWIAIDDHVAATIHLLEHDVSGPVNLTAPQPVTNADFARTLGRVLHRPAVLPVPKVGPALLLGSELADNLLYRGQRVLPRALEHAGFRFRYPDLEPALRAVLNR